MHLNCPLWRCSYRKEKHALFTDPDLASLYLWGSGWYVTFEECILIGDLGCPAGGVQGQIFCSSRAERVFRLAKNMAFGDQGTWRLRHPCLAQLRAPCLKESRPDCQCQACDCRRLKKLGTHLLLEVCQCLFAIPFFLPCNREAPLLQGHSSGVSHPAPELSTLIDHVEVT
jgi:hypothetical protein